MSRILQDLLEKIRFGERQSRENLTIFPLFLEAGEGEGIPYLLLEEALRMGCLEIGEVDEFGRVNTVFIENKATRPVLILDGEEILGAKQNRMVNATILIAAQARVKVPVSCVERGRWHYTSPVFERAGEFGYSNLRRQKARQVASSLKENREFMADQHAIWEEIDRKQEQRKGESPTEAMNEVYRSYAEQLQNLIGGFELQASQSGVAVYISNRFVCLDLFDCPETLEKLWKKLLKSYALDAMEWREEKAAEGQPHPQGVLEAIARGECSISPSVGLGRDLRVEGPGIIGAGLALDDRILHFSVFADEADDRDEALRSKMSRPSMRRRSLR